MQDYRVKKFLLVLALGITLTAGFARNSQALLDKTRFVAHLGIAYFCFHHWVSNPYREGKFVTACTIGRYEASAKPDPNWLQQFKSRPQ